MTKLFDSTHQLNFLTPVNSIQAQSRNKENWLLNNTCSECDAALSITVQSLVLVFKLSLVLVFLRFKLTNVPITINDYNIALGPVRYSLHWTMINDAIHCMKLAGSL